MLEEVLQYIFSESIELNEIRELLDGAPVENLDFIGEFLFIDSISKYLYKTESSHENWVFNKKIDGIRGLFHSMEERITQEVGDIRNKLSKRNEIFFSSGKNAYDTQWDVVLTTYIVVFFVNGFKILEHLYFFLIYSNDYLSIDDVTKCIKKAEIEMNLPHISLSQEWNFLLSLKTRRKI